MAFLQWRRFNFFEKEHITAGPISSSTSTSTLEATESIKKLTELEITCAHSGRGQLLIGDANGFVHRINRQFDITSFQAYPEKVTNIYQINEKPILITAGYDDTGTNPVIKIWNQEKQDPHQENEKKPFCMRVIRASTGINPAAITCMSVTNSLTHLVIGFDDGHLMILRGDVTRNRACKQELFKISDHTITNLALQDQLLKSFKFSSLLLSLPLNRQKVNLFVSTTKEIFSYFLESKDIKQSQIVLDSDIGCDPGCGCLLIDPKQSENCSFIVGKKNGIYFYEHDGRGRCLAFGGEKLIVRWFKSYLVVVAKEVTSFKSPLVMNFIHESESVKSNPSLASNRMNMVTIYDIKNKYIAFNSTLPPVLEVLVEWGSLYFLTKNGNLFHFKEKDTSTKLENLFKKNQFPLAIQLAQFNQYDQEDLANIYRQYGDYLYKKSDFDDAMTQYIKTIGKVEASYIIRRFLDSLRIENLSTYLEELHKKRLANNDHTTLLLNCYTKLRNKKKLNEFIRESSERDEEGSPKFDVETAIIALRQSGFFDEALYLCEEYEMHDCYFKIYLEDRNDEIIKAIEYIREKLPNDQLRAIYLKTYGRYMMEREPEATTELAKTVCLRVLVNDSVNSELNNDNQKQSKTKDDSINFKDFSPKDFLEIFPQNSEKVLNFLEFIAEERPDKMDHSTNNTLIDLYLLAYKKEKDENKKTKLKEKILSKLTDSNSLYDVGQVMLSCQRNNFIEGVLHMYQKLEMYDLILAHYIHQYDNDNILKICKEFGDTNEQLWVKAFQHFAESASTNNFYLLQTLKEINNRKLIHPVQVIQILSTNAPNAPLSIIKDYLIRCLTKENEIVTENERLIHQYMNETAKMKEEIESYKSKPKVFQSSRCLICDSFLELPSVHFLCGHSFHFQCFESYSADESECPLCLPEHRKLLSLIESRKSFDITQNL